MAFNWNYPDAASLQIGAERGTLFSNFTTQLQDEGSFTNMGILKRSEAIRNIWGTQMSATDDSKMNISSIWSTESFSNPFPLMKHQGYEQQGADDCKDKEACASAPFNLENKSYCFQTGTSKVTEEYTLSSSPDSGISVPEVNGNNVQDRRGRSNDYDEMSLPANYKITTNEFSKHDLWSKRDLYGHQNWTGTKSTATEVFADNTPQLNQYGSMAPPRSLFGRLTVSNDSYNGVFDQAILQENTAQQTPRGNSNVEILLTKDQQNEQTKGLIAVNDCHAILLQLKLAFEFVLGIPEAADAGVEPGKSSASTILGRAAYVSCQLDRLNALLNELKENTSSPSDIFKARVWKQRTSQNLWSMLNTLKPEELLKENGGEADCSKVPANCKAYIEEIQNIIMEWKHADSRILGELKTFVSRVNEGLQIEHLGNFIRLLREHYGKWILELDPQIQFHLWCIAELSRGPGNKASTSNPGFSTESVSNQMEGCSSKLPKNRFPPSRKPKYRNGYRRY